MKSIQTILIFFTALFSAVPVAVASNLPACPSDESAYWDNCFGTITFTNGDKYVGEHKDDKRHGQGTYTFGPNSEFAGDKYVGEYKDNKRHGQGTYTYADGNKYVGELKDGKFDGQGIFYFASGAKDVGTFKDDALNGYAVRYNSDGTILKQGIWKDDEFQYAQNSSPASPASNLPACPSDASAYWHNCFGTSTYGDGDKYVGEYRDGKANGKGTYTFADGTTYVGEFRDNNKHGQFTVTFADGGKFVGEYKDNKKNGPGTATFASGNKYVGEYRDGERNGQFNVTYANGDRYDGGYKDDGMGKQLHLCQRRQIWPILEWQTAWERDTMFASGDKYVGVQERKI